MRQRDSKSRLPTAILFSGIMLACFGLIAIYDASVIDAYRTFGDKFHYVKQQALWLCVGVVVALVTANIPILWIKKNAYLLYGVTLFLMLVVIIPGIGSKFLGARRWLAIGPIILQPSELLKITFAIYLAHWLETERKIKQFLLLIGINAFLIMLQPDLGTAIILIGVSFLIYYLSGAKPREIFSFSLILLIAISALILVSPYRFNRVKTFMDPTLDPLGSSYHINQVLYGLGSGGMSGVGLGRSRQKYDYLPEATTDSIFVIIAEEFGFIGSTALIIILVGIMTASFKISLNVVDKFDKLLSSGITLLFLLQIFVNLSSMVALIPLTGVPLPFISYGGSSLVTNFIALGLLINISKRA
ncbi:TPA: putative lipid II flippase FtsW [Candidatus Collierbacteria bacterium]|uniref:Probable peptidoglycan glycosyltransferase FtsW n=1 Tax=Candidatus Collierbacteria bacterium GW2011_GWB2_44_22 TaxID=1618387 RepID=A0A0G1HXB5_9BACT|nr:MAG: Stage V sporulation protein E [Candidatus Collierbacteria bacterium GW2011_GWA2_44_13]KKT51118.1 MAG: Stage V sporulation protein E [Candidatus Collierbacteria bacterium GW2011_GWB1_44_197]KKT51575.1 MAG: Stage V sporulation protein E [Candidatus Collierbacteria bacterium GW2011_GWB2_44_22]KKT63027.1 MAG: Stage V sporulation protein E [Candidatus Collierbacteria bacterium GW2011_GWD1_44_27]KKT65838.1 MAG: Stage V sporulation protein E [Candidatus Collierbacteria bacterium GW2011_GWC2_44